MAKLLKGSGITAPEPCLDPLQAHLWMLRRLTDSAFKIEINELIPTPKRAVLLSQIANSIGRLNVTAEQSKQLELLREELDKARDQLVKAREEAERMLRTRGLPIDVFTRLEERARAENVPAPELIERAVLGLLTAAH